MYSDLKIGFSPAAAPDGSVWVSVTVVVGVASFTFGVPLDQSRVFQVEFADRFREAVRDAQKLRKRGIVGANGSMLEMPCESEMKHTCEGETGTESCLGCAVVRAAEVSD
jgi:hypothetical protein